jgi:bifunctional oligoribonuclease and PAP phosphatase NrnA
MSRQPAKNLRKLISSAKSAVIVTHWSPDGDAMGSSLGLWNYLTSVAGLKTTVIVPNEYPDFLAWLPGNNKVLNHQLEPAKCEKLISRASLLFTLDFNSYKRLDKLGKVLETAPAPKVLIDHHVQPDDYAEFVYHDVKSGSTCELIYDLIVALGDKKSINKKIAACLYTGIMTDTGSFRFPSVTAHTHQVIAGLLETGIKQADIHSAVYDSYSLNRIRLLGYALSEKLTVIGGMPVAYFVIKASELQKFDFKKGDLEGVVNYPFSIKGIEVCALFHEHDNQVKVSFRSKGGIDMNVFARKYFNGGGHVNAAGGRGSGSLENTEKKFLKHVSELF